MAQRYVEWYSVHKNSVALRRIALESIRRSSWALNCLAWHEIFRCCDESSSLILRSALHLLINFKILVFLVVTAAHNYLFIKYSIKLWTKPSITFTMMTSKFEINYSSNTEANPKSGFETVVIANCILNTPLMLLSIIGNALVLVAILRTPSIRSPSVIFLCNLAVSDLLVGLVVQPVYVAAEIAITVRALLQAAKLMGFAGFGVSLTTMTAITVDRFLALHYHLQYPNFMTTSRAIYTIITIWLIITLFSFFNSLVAEYLLLSCSFLYHKLPFSQLGLFHQDSPNCSSASVTNSRSTTSSGKFNWYKQPSHTTIN